MNKVQEFEEDEVRRRADDDVRRAFPDGVGSHGKGGDIPLRPDAGPSAAGNGVPTGPGALDVPIIQSDADLPTGNVPLTGEPQTQPQQQGLTAHAQGEPQPRQAGQPSQDADLYDLANQISPDRDPVVMDAVVERIKGERDRMRPVLTEQGQAAFDEAAAMSAGELTPRHYAALYLGAPLQDAKQARTLPPGTWFLDPRGILRQTNKPRERGYRASLRAPEGTGGIQEPEQYQKTLRGQ